MNIEQNTAARAAAENTLDHPGQRARKLAAELAQAMADWSREDGKIWVAHVYPASAYEHPVAFENGSATDRLPSMNLRPLPNRLGHNGPYFEGIGTAVERDCNRIDGHSDLFRDLERFEPDLRNATYRVWQCIVDLHVVRQRAGEGTATADEALESAVDGLYMAFQYLQEGYLVAEVLDDRARQRERRREARDFEALVSRQPRDQMSGLDRLAEEARLEWMISTLLDRMNELRHVERQEWPKIDREALERFNARLEKLINPPSAEALQAMSEDDLADELRTLEARIHDTRKTIALIHAVRTVRNA